MQLTNPTAAAFPTALYTQRLNSATADLGMVDAAKLDTPAAVDGALARLHSASAGIHDALAGAASLPSGLPGGVTSFPRTASELVARATAEVMRATQGSPVDQALVASSIKDAAGKLQQAVGLVAHPPTDEVYDGS